MVGPPVEIKAVRDEGLLQVMWADGASATLPFWGLRCACTCAACIDEMTGRPLLNPATVPRDVHPVRMELVGNYAVRIDWSDGHNTGLYTWERLAELAKRRHGSTG